MTIDTDRAREAERLAATADLQYLFRWSDMTPIQKEMNRHARFLAFIVLVDEEERQEEARLAAKGVAP